MGKGVWEDRGRGRVREGEGVKAREDARLTKGRKGEEGRGRGEKG